MDALYDAVTRLMDCHVAQATEGEPSELALRLDACKHATGILTDLRDAIELALIDNMPEDEMVVADVGTVKRTNKPSTRVKDKQASKKAQRDMSLAVAQRVGVDPYTGEIDKDRRDAAREAILMLAESVSFGARSFKSNAETNLGIDPDDYVTTSWKQTIQIIPFGEEPYAEPDGEPA